MLRALLNKYLPRFFIASLFLVSAILYIFTFNEQVDGIARTMIGPALALAVTVIATTIKLVGGVMLLFDFKTKGVAYILVAFIIVATFVEYTYAGNRYFGQAFQNLAIVGGLLLLAQRSESQYS